VNGGREHALELAAWLADLRSAVHLIPCNPGPGSPFARPTPQELEAFFRWLVEAGQFTLVRATRGAEIQAACGQLGGGQTSGGGAR
jgi:23S rRNA (adenine2503-C2)-methyltransferase